MRSEEEEDRREYRVVVNDEEQYSIWFADRDVPAGWRDCGVTGPKSHCLEHIRNVWTDMRPRSLREEMLRWEREPPEPLPPLARKQGEKDELVARLEEDQPITIALRPEATRSVFEQQLERGFVLVRFDRTGTEIGVRLDAAATQAAIARLGAGAAIEVVGRLVLNYNRVRFVGLIEAGTFRGHGRVEFLEVVRPGDLAPRAASS